ncbi:MAG: transglutaminase-like domain-containing protein [Symbiobacteriia bacterium]
MTEGADFQGRRLTLWERFLRTLWLAVLLLPFAAGVPFRHPGWLGVLFLLLTILAWPIFQMARARGQVLWLGFIGSAILLAESWRLGGAAPALALALYVAIALVTLAFLEWSEPGHSLTAAILAGALVFGVMAAAGAASVSLGMGLPGAAAWFQFADGRGLGGIFGTAPNPTRAARALDRVSMARSWDLLDTAVLTIAGAPGPAYWSLATYDDFDGRNWLGSGEVPTAPPAGAGTLLPPELTGTGTTQWTVTVRRLTADNGPLIYTGTPEAVTVSGGAVPIRVQPQLRTLWATGAETYTLRLAMPQVDPALLQAAGFASPPPALSRDLAVPADTSLQVAELAKSVAGNVAGPWQAAQRVADYLRIHATYTTQFAVPDGNVVNGFLLDRRSGYCDQFSTSFIIMMRELGIPARWVMGYRVTGEAEQAGSAGSGSNGAVPDYLVRARDAHSWAEVYVAPYGWVPIDPTPGGDVLGSYVTPTPAPSPAPGQPGSSSPGATPPSPSAPGASPAPTADGKAASPALPAALGWLLALAVLAAGLIGLVDTVLRRRRRVSPARLVQRRTDRLWRVMSTLAGRQEPSTPMTNITPRELLGLLPAESRQAILPAVRLLEQVWYGEAALPLAEVMAAEALVKAEGNRVSP